MKLFVLIFASLLSGCMNSEKYRNADEKVLCDPQTHEAYYVKPNIGETTFLMRNPNLDGDCK